MPPVLHDYRSWMEDGTKLARYIRRRLKGEVGPAPLESRDEDFHDLLEDAYRRAEPDRKAAFLRELQSCLVEFWNGCTANEQDQTAFVRAVNLALRIGTAAVCELDDVFPKTAAELIATEGNVEPCGLAALKLLAIGPKRDEKFWTDIFRLTLIGFQPTRVGVEAARTAGEVLSAYRNLTPEEVTQLFHYAAPYEETGADLILGLQTQPWLSAWKTGDIQGQSNWLSLLAESLDTMLGSLEPDKVAPFAVLEPIRFILNAFPPGPEVEAETNHLNTLLDRFEKGESVLSDLNQTKGAEEQRAKFDESLVRMTRKNVKNIQLKFKKKTMIYSNNRRESMAIRRAITKQKPSFYFSEARA